ncbi:DUF4097 family beta strand repeat-containing protein [Paenibacillus woosongensis]|uniref:DUF4097 family beta strand repeat-containing protein n=1 Tax=Paenibacillus woosongensis TaxID=307580 RepID=A0AA95KVE5_9BACL|nr:DUF4097 family beta strand repeat-containing protein [Paenibacillus woosongensis]WHX48400.1 DUF4097 family beta strand repeat-containing protein [Paenibacillus woosongensis]
MTPDQMTASDTARHNKKSVPKGKIRRYRPRRLKRKFMACMLSALLPGLGHLYLRMFWRGIAIIYFLILDASALIYFSSVRMTINIPFLFLLGILIPMMYFYSIYDVLQSTDVVNARVRSETTQREEAAGAKEHVWKGILSGLLLMAGGGLIFLLSQKPPWLAAVIQASAGYAAAVLLILSGAALIVREGRRRRFRTGRMTASLLLIGIGIILLVDVATGSNFMLHLLKWWPLLFVVAGLEQIYVFLWNRRKTAYPLRLLRVDLKGLLLSLFVAFSVFAVTQQDHYMHLWNRVSLDLTAAGTDFSAEEGYSLIKDQLEIPIDLSTEQIVLNGINGNIDVRRAEIEGIRVESTVWVDQLPAEEAKLVAEETELQVTEGKTLTLNVKDKVYGASGKRHPRMNMTVFLPENRFLDIDISTSNGKIKMSGIRALKQIKLQTGNGDLKLWDVNGDVTAKTLNGDAEMYRIFGNVSVDTQGGNMMGNMITGQVSMSTLVGNIALMNVDDDIHAATKNGNIVIHGVAAALKAESLNGKIQIESPQIEGDWNVYSAVGEMTITIPEEGDYTLEGSSGYGDIITELPFSVDNKTIHGIVGSGEYLVKVEGNSNLYVNQRISDESALR